MLKSSSSNSTTSTNQPARPPAQQVADGMGGASGAELKACCTEAGMFALRERRVHVTQEDFEMAVAKVTRKDGDKDVSLRKLWK
jgi:26S proteasome regulatory subunit T6